MSGAAIAAEVALAYAEAGRDAGDGLGAVSVTITRPGQPTGPEWNPTPGAPVVHTFTAKPHPRHTHNGQAWHWVRVSWSIRW